MRCDWLTRKADFKNRNITQDTRGHGADVPEHECHSHNEYNYTDRVQEQFVLW